MSSDLEKYTKFNTTADATGETPFIIFLSNGDLQQPVLRLFK